MILRNGLDKTFKDCVKYMILLTQLCKTRVFIISEYSQNSNYNNGNFNNNDINSFNNVNNVNNSSNDGFNANWRIHVWKIGLNQRSILLDLNSFLDPRKSFNTLREEIVAGRKCHESCWY